MGISNELINAFVNITKDDSDKKNEETVYGTAVKYNGTMWARLDGSDRLTPIESTTNVEEGERVIVLIKNHTAIVTGNLTSPSARTDEIKDVDTKVTLLGTKISEFDVIIADKVSTKELEAQKGRIDNLESENVTINQTLKANEASIGNLQAENVDIKGKITAAEANITKIEAEKLDVKMADIIYATVEDLNATNVNVHNLQSTFATFEETTTNKLDANEANITKLFAEKLSSSEADITFAKITDLNAVSGKFNSLQSEYGKFKELTTNDITAINGSIDEIKTNNVEIAGRVTANEGSIKNLNTVKLNTADAYLAFAKISDLNATNVNVTNLNADLAKVNTLLSGSVTAGSTETIVLNAKNTTIENALIKDAMIDSLSFNKISGVDINTTKLTVHSNDGKSTWKDNTIKIADATRTRVQIGKDSEGDYNIYIWDKSGNLMFDPLGLTDKGVTREVIDNSNVKENAGIAGSKLDIDSVVTEINGNTTTIKSSLIKFDENNQTLDVAFKSMQTSISNQTETITTIQGDVSTANTNANSALSKANDLVKRADDGEFKGTSTVIANVKASYDQTSINDYATYDRSVNWNLSAETEARVNDIVHLCILNTTKNAYCFIVGKVTAVISSTRITVTSYGLIDKGADGTSGAKGDMGATGKGIKSVTPEYYLSTSNSSQTGGSWKTTQDTWSAGKYYWTRDKIVWSDNTTTYTTATLATGLNNANSTANTANTNATNASSTASSALSTANSAKSTADSASSKADSATSTANAAKSSADSANNKIDNLQVGGRNLYYLKDFAKYIRTRISSYSITDGEISLVCSGTDMYIGEVIQASGKAWSSIHGPLMYVEGAKYVTLNVSNSLFDKNYYNFYDRDKNSLATFSVFGSNKRTVTVPSNAVYMSVRIGYQNSVSGTTYKLKVKVEIGNKATDWTPAIEDTQTQITTVEKKVETNTTDISTANGKISTLITNVSNAQTDISTIKGDVTTAKTSISTLTNNYSTLNQTVSSLSSTVGSHTSSITTIQNGLKETTNKIDNLQIGGRNLFLNSGEPSKISKGGVNTSYYTATIESDDSVPSKKVNVFTTVTAGGGGPYFSVQNYSQAKIKKGEIITVSVWMKCSANKTGSAFTVEFLDNIIYTRPNLSTTWQKYIATGTANRDVGIVGGFEAICFYNNRYMAVGDKLYISSIKVERGNKATDWAPAPEDTQTQITTISDKQSTFEQTLNGLTSQVSSLDSTVKTKADSSTVSSLSTTVNTLKSDLSGFKTTVSNTYTTKADFNALQVGGRNILRYSGNFTTLANLNSYWYDNGGGIAIDTSVKYLGQNTLKTTLKSGIVGDWYELDMAKTYTYSVMVISNKAFNTGNVITPLHFHCCTEKKFTSSNAKGVDVIGCKQTIDEANKWTRLYLTFKPNAKYFRPFVYSNATGADSVIFNIAYMKLEEGNRASDWTPAPEDIDSNIASVDVKFKSYSTTTEMNSAIETSKSSILSSVSSTYATKSQMQTANGNITSLTTRMQSAEQKLTRDGITSIVSDYYATKTEFDNLQVGGRNLILNSNSFSTNYDPTTTYKGLRVYKLRYDNTRGDYVDTISLKKSHFSSQYVFQNGDEVTLSFYAKADKDGLKTLHFWYPNVYGVNNVSNSCVTVPVTTEWKRYEVHWKMGSGKDSTNFTPSMVIGRLQKGISDYGTLYICGVKFEVGNKSTPYTVAPEDVDSSITSVSTNLQSQITQNATNINLKVSKDGIISAINQTAEIVKILASKIELTGKVTFSMLDSSTQYIINSTSKSYAMTGAYGSPRWVHLGTLTSSGDSSNFMMEIQSGNGYNAGTTQNSTIEIMIKDGYQTTLSATSAFGVSVIRRNCPDTVKVAVRATAHDKCDVWVYFPWAYWSGSYTVSGRYSSWVSNVTNQAAEPTTGTLQPVEYRYDGQSVASNIYTANTTTIDGGKITTGSITASKISAGAITADKLAVDAIKSRNYVKDTAGSFLNLKDGTFDSKYLKWDTEGKLSATGGTIAGFKVSDKYIQSSTYNVGIGTHPDWAFWAGGNTIENAKFRVNNSGKMWVKDIAATGGTIGGLTINKDSLSFSGKGKMFMSANIEGTTKFSFNTLDSGGFNTKILDWSFIDGKGNVYSSGYITPAYVVSQHLKGDFINANKILYAGDSTQAGQILLYSGNSSFSSLSYDSTNLKISTPVKAPSFEATSESYFTKSGVAYKDPASGYNAAIKANGSIIISSNEGYYIGTNHLKITADSGDGYRVRISSNRGNSGGGIHLCCDYGVNVVNWDNNVFTLIRASAFNVSSLLEYKTNIKPLVNPFDIIQAGDIYTYNLKQDIKNGMATDCYGFVIGEGYRVPSNVLSYDKKTIDQYAMSGILWGATKELIKRSNSHDDKIRELETENNKLKQQIATLEDKLNAFISGDFSIKNLTK